VCICYFFTCVFNNPEQFELLVHNLPAADCHWQHNRQTLAVLSTVCSKPAIYYPLLNPQTMEPSSAVRTFLSDWTCVYLGMNSVLCWEWSYSWPLITGPIGCPETSESNCHCSLCNKPQNAVFNVARIISRIIIHPLFRVSEIRSTVALRRQRVALVLPAAVHAKHVTTYGLNCNI